jgi:predicted kinase
MNVISKKPIAYIICGFIGSGKTTFAKKLEKKTGAMRITKDEWMIKIFGNSPLIDRFDEFDARVSELSRSISFQFLQHGIDVIIDEGFWAKSQRDEMKKNIEQLGATAVLYYVKCSMDIMKKRTINRNSKLSNDSFDISEKMFDSYVKHWDPPNENEEYILATE